MNEILVAQLLATRAQLDAARTQVDAMLAMATGDAQFVTADTLGLPDDALSGVGPGACDHPEKFRKDCSTMGPGNRRYQCLRCGDIVPLADLDKGGSV